LQGLSLVPQAEGRLLGSQAGKHGRAQRGQQQPCHHGPGHMRSRSVHAVLWVLLYVCESAHQLTARSVVSFNGQVRLSPQAGEVTMPGSIELLVYSGRPNPRVELDPSTEAELARRLASLGPLDHAFAADERLGYTGLRIVGLPTSEIREVDLSAGG